MKDFIYDCSHNAPKCLGMRMWSSGELEFIITIVIVLHVCICIYVLLYTKLWMSMQIKASEIFKILSWSKLFANYFLESSLKIKTL